MNISISNTNEYDNRGDNNETLNPLFTVVARTQYQAEEKDYSVQKFYDVDGNFGPPWNYGGSSRLFGIHKDHWEFTVALIGPILGIAVRVALSWE